MTTFRNWPYLERLTNDDFLKLLPHLSLEQQFLTQIFVPKKKWIHLLDANLQTLQLKCGVCNRQVPFEDIKSHSIQNDHSMSLMSNVKQFYHPFYTYGKGDMKLAKGEYAPKDIRENALRELNTQMKSFRKEFILANQFANIAQRRIRGVEEDQLIESNLRKRIENPDDMIVMVCLPMENIAKLLFCLVSGEWQPLIVYKNIMNTLFYCNICSANCYGIETLNSHLNDPTHRLKQLKIFELCYEDSPRVNKNCRVYFGNSFSFSIKDDVWNLHRSQNENNLEDRFSKLPNEIAQRIKALNKYVPNIHTCCESSVKKDIEVSGKFKSNEDLGHLGVEYVLKIMKNENDRDPRFECGLCEFVGNDNKMQSHLLSYDHKKKYLDLHYCDTIKRYEALIGHMCYKEFRYVMSEIVYKIAAEVEKYHSRSLPYAVSLSDYKKRRPDLVAEAYALLHATQNRGPSFSNVLSQDDIINLKNSAKQLAKKKICYNNECIIFTTAPKAKIYLNQISHDPVVRFREYNLKMNKNCISPATRKFDSHSEQSNTRVLESRARSRSPIYIKPEISIQRTQNVYTSNVPNQNIWDTYRCEIAFAANEIEVAYESYRQNPENHPLYEEEWNTFWHRRKKELEQEGYYHRSYNFQPEWVYYFKQRIEVLFGEALQKSKINIRNRLDIPLDAEEDCQRSQKSANIDSRIKQYAIVNEQIDIPKRHKRRNSPDFKDFEQNKREFSEQMRTENIKKDLNENRSEIIVLKISDNHSNIIRVLRLIIALEEHLGSLGGKVMDLLSNALQLEKKYSENNVEFEAKVLTVANCHLLETAMEKLKGILFAGLLDEKKIPGFNRVIQHTAKLLKYAEKMGWRMEDIVSEKVSFLKSNRARVIQKQMYDKQNRNEGSVSQVPAEKALSDTLMDLVNEPLPVSSNEQFGNCKKNNLRLPVCPSPPNIKETSIGANLFAGFKGTQSNSGLASFNTKLSLDQANQLQKVPHESSFQSNYVELRRNRVSDVGNLYNNSFKNNNDTRTNINTRTYNGQGVGGAMNNSYGSSQIRNLQFIPNMGQNNAIYQGGGGVNQNWLQWN